MRSRRDEGGDEERMQKSVVKGAKRSRCGALDRQFIWTAELLEMRSKSKTAGESILSGFLSEKWIRDVVLLPNLTH